MYAYLLGCIDFKQVNAWKPQIQNKAVNIIYSIVKLLSTNIPLKNKNTYVLSHVFKRPAVWAVIFMTLTNCQKTPQMQAEKYHRRIPSKQ